MGIIALDNEGELSISILRFVDLIDCCYLPVVFELCNDHTRFFAAFVGCLSLLGWWRVYRRAGSPRRLLAADHLRNSQQIPCGFSEYTFGGPAGHSIYIIEDLYKSVSWFDVTL